MRIQRTVDLAYFVNACCQIATRIGRAPLSDRQQNEIIGTLLHVSGESVRLWRRGMSHPPYDKLLSLIVGAADASGGEFALLVEIYGEQEAARLWGGA